MSLEAGLGATPLPQQPQGPSIVSRELKAAQTRTKELNAQQIEANEDLYESQQEASNPFAANRKIKEKMHELKQRVPPQRETAKAAKSVISKESALKQGQENAKEFVKNNPELKEDDLSSLLKQLLDGDHTPEEILKMAQRLHEDPSLVDQVLVFLQENSPHELEKRIKKAQDNFRARKRREIAAGKNIQKQALEFSTKGLGEPTFLRDLYRKITGHDLDDHQLFEELSNIFSYSQMLDAVKFLLHSLGADVNSKGPSIDPPELLATLTEVRKLQLVLGIYRFFESRMDLLYDFFDRYEIDYPPKLTFQIIARNFVNITKDHYPNTQKVMLLESALYLKDNPMGFMIVLTQMRDAIRNISPRIFYTLKHKQDLFSALVGAIDQIDESLEEEFEEE